jgi:hypothetical protein
MSLPLISEPYRKQQAIMHDTTVYGVASAKFAPLVASTMNKAHVTELLDYGAGSRLTLMKTFDEDRLVDHAFRYFPYEPAVPKHAERPEPREMCACIDVLEHIEPELLDNVLDDLARVTLKIGFFTVSCVPAAKVLPDGRNAHLIQAPPEWWLPKIMRRFELHTFQTTEDGFIVLVAPKDLQ